MVSCLSFHASGSGPYWFLEKTICFTGWKRLLIIALGDGPLTPQHKRGGHSRQVPAEWRHQASDTADKNRVSISWLRTAIWSWNLVARCVSRLWSLQNQSICNYIVLRRSWRDYHFKKQNNSGVTSNMHYLNNPLPNANSMSNMCVLPVSISLVMHVKPFLNKIRDFGVGPLALDSVKLLRANIICLYIGVRECMWHVTDPCRQGFMTSQLHFTILNFE